MAATNQTTNYALPIFTAENHPEWLVDWNNAMTKLDSTIKNAFDQIETGVSDGSEIKEEIDAINTAITNIQGDISNINTTLTVTEINDNIQAPSSNVIPTGITKKYGSIIELNLRIYVANQETGSSNYKLGTLLKELPSSTTYISLLGVNNNGAILAQIDTDGKIFGYTGSTTLHEGNYFGTVIYFE